MKDKVPANSKANRYSPTTRPPSFDRAEVPAYLLQLEIDSLPANRAFFIDTESEQAWNDSATMIVDKNTGALYLDGSAEVDAGQDKPISPLGLVGVMRIETIDQSGDISSFFVADLRFIENHELSFINDIDNTPTDQEEFNSWMDFKKDLRKVVAFVAPVPDSKASGDGIIPAVYYGPSEYYGTLDALREQGDKIISKHIKRQRQADKLAKAATQKQAVTSVNETEKAEPPKARHRLFSRKK